MRLTKILAGCLLVLALGLAVLAWMMSRDVPRDVHPVEASLSPSLAAEMLNSKQPVKYSVVAASSTIAAGQKISAADLEVVEKTENVPGAFAHTDDLVGKTTLVAFTPGQVLQEQFLVAGLSLQLESGQRAVSVAVKEPMAAGHHIRPGDFVDVFFTLQDEAQKIKVDTQTRLLMARARVLAYGANSVENPPQTLAQRKAEQAKESNQRSGNREEQRGRAEIANTAVLAVPLNDVQRLALAEKYGQLTLALRHPDDLEMPDATLFAALPTALRPLPVKGGAESALNGMDRAYAGLRFSDLADGGGKPKTVAAKAPRSVAKPGASNSGGQTVELVNGTSIQTVRY